MNDLFRRQFGITVKAAASGDARAFDVIASTDDVDMCGDVLVQDWDLRRFNQNPVVLYFHNIMGCDPEDSLPVGFGTETSVVDGKLRSTIHFVTEDANPLAEQCFQGFKQGSLRAVSVGFRSKLGRMETRNGADVFVLSGNELLEISVCPVPINPNAVLDEKSKEHDALVAFVKAHNPATREAPPDTEIGPMKTLLKALGLKDDASEAEAVSVANALISGSKAVELRVLEATGAKSVDEAIGIIKAGTGAIAQLGVATKALADARADVETRDRDVIVAKGLADKKLTPALRDWANEKAADGSFKVSLETLAAFLKSAPVHPVLGADLPRVPGSKEEPPPGAGSKAWEDLPPGEKHDLKVTSPEVYEATKADWERRGKPAPTWNKKRAAA